MNSKIKAISAFVLSAALSVSLSVPAFADTSVEEAQSTSGSSQSAIKGDGQAASLLASVSLSASSGKSGLTKVGSYYYYYKSGKKVKSAWKTIKGARYYFRSNGRAATGSFKVKKTRYIFSSKGVLQKASKTVKVVKVGKSRYLVDAKGVAVTGWQVISGRLYHASSTGKCASSTTYDKIPFNSSAYATPSNKRAKVMIWALGVVKKIVKTGMTKQQKLEACFRYFSQTCIWAPEFFPPSGKRQYSGNVELVPHLKSGWQIEWAYTTYTEKRGNCFGQTCHFCALAKALGYTPYLIFDTGVHICARIDGKYWDVTGNIRGGSTPYNPTNTKLTTKFW